LQRRSEALDRIGDEALEDLSMKRWIPLAFAAAVLLPWAASGAPPQGLPAQVCSGPAGDSNPNCRSRTPRGSLDAAVPEPGAAAAFALGAALVALRTRRR
jgi:hypothetical protein